LTASVNFLAISYAARHIKYNLNSGYRIAMLLRVNLVQKLVKITTLKYVLNIKVVSCFYLSINSTLLTKALYLAGNKACNIKIKEILNSWIKLNQEYWKYSTLRGYISKIRPLEILKVLRPYN
jgi:hypothetical protein